jgi:triphosphatase
LRYMLFFLSEPEIKGLTWGFCLYYLRINGKIFEFATKERSSMEIELKYSIGTDEIVNAIWEDEEIKEMEENGSRSNEELKAIYFDTVEFDLLKHDIAYRIRNEGSRMIATLKWNGKTVGPLHTREELNINLGEDACQMDPDPTVFSQSDIGAELLALIGGKPLYGFMEVHVSRQKVRVDTNQAILEIALDSGFVITEKGTCPIREAEIELYSGKEEGLITLGERLSQKYALLPETRSKFARGLALLGKI